MKKVLESPMFFNAMLAVLVGLFIFNQFMISTIYSTTGLSGSSSDITTSSVSATDLQSMLTAVIPKGVPAVYGAELGVKYDDISASNAGLADQTISKLAVYDTKITLEGADLERYIKIASEISCEYCCGAQAIIFNNGAAACGCAHSQAMRGLAKYLIKNHPNDFTDDEILEELGKWKTLFFPTNLAQKALILKEKGIELNYINIASNKYRGIESGASSGGSMVGGC